MKYRNQQCCASIRWQLWSCLTLASLLLASLLPAPSAYSQDLPSLGGSGEDMVSPASERALGDRFIRDLRRQAPTVSDPPLKYFSESLINELAASSELTDRRIQPVLIDSRLINAFAAPGGVVGVHLGLFNHANNVHELSAVLAHELAHLSQRHFARSVEYQSKQAIPTLAALIASIALMATVGGDAGVAALSASQAAAQDSALRYSREREQEADRIGIDTLQRAGLDPRAMAGMFERMSRASRFDNIPPEFLLTHPVTTTRISDARNQAGALPTRAHLDRIEYQFMQARVRVHYAATREAAIALYLDEMKQGRLSPAAIQYGLANAYSMAGQHKQARAVTEKLLQAMPDNLFVHLLMAEVLIDGNEPAEALPLLQRQLAWNPDNAPLSMFYAMALGKLSRHADAVVVLQRQSLLRPNDADIWYQLAEEAGLANDVTTVHQARAEYFQLIGDFDRAVQHLELALKLTDPARQFQLTQKLLQRIADIRKTQDALS